MFKSLWHGNQRLKVNVVSTLDEDNINDEMLEGGDDNGTSSQNPDKLKFTLIFKFS